MWNRTSFDYYVEKLLPWIASPIGAVLAYYLASSFEFSEGQRLAILQSVISTAAILMGFMGTILALVISFSDKEVFRRLMVKGKSQVLLDYLLHPMYSLFIVVVLSLVLLMIPSGAFATLMIGLLGFFGVLAVFTVFRLKKPLYNLVQSVHSDA